MKSCSSCRYYYEGQCRRYPPNWKNEFALTSPERWCGEWRGTPRAERDEQNKVWEKAFGEPIPEHLRYSGLEEEP